MPGEWKLSCPICAGAAALYAPVTILEKYDVEYARCERCGLIYLPDAFWLDEAYERAIYDGDVGLMRRCRIVAALAGTVVRTEGLRRGRFLDWAGGYGILTRMMRDKGLEFYHHERYAQNLFARGFERDPAGASFDLATAVEVFEHLTDPFGELLGLSKATDRILFTTLLQPAAEPPRPDEWWYFLPESGQHVTFYTYESLRILGERLGYRFTSDGENYHMFHRVPLRPVTRTLLSPTFARARGAAAAVTRRTLEGVRQDGG